MFHWDQRFFGLTSATKVDLFLREIQAIMKIYPGTGYWDAYLLPIPIRKWLIEEHMKQTEEQEVLQRQQNQKQTFQRPAFTPLTNAEKQQVRSQTQPMQSVKK